MPSKRRPKKKTHPSVEPAPTVRPVILDAGQLHGLIQAVDAYFQREYQEWVDKGYSERWSLDWATAVVQPARDGIHNLVVGFDGAFD